MNVPSPDPPLSARGNRPAGWRILGGLMLIASVGLTSCQALLHGL
jgi:hypothetical protein